MTNVTDEDLYLIILQYGLIATNSQVKGSIVSVAPLPRSYFVVVKLEGTDLSYVKEIFTTQNYSDSTSTTIQTRGKTRTVTHPPRLNQS